MAYTPTIIRHAIEIYCRLNLTAASHVHLLEPQWNPSLEDQALARAHRLGQARPVTTIRYVMENSFEEVRDGFSSRHRFLAITSIRAREI